MHHGVLDDAVVKRCVCLGCREFAVKQEITCFEKGAVLGELFDRVTAIEYYSPFRSAIKRDLFRSLRWR